MDNSVIICIFVVLAMIVVLLKLIAKSLREKQNRKNFEMYKSAVKEYAKQLVEKSFDTLTYEDALEFIGIMRLYNTYGKEETVNAFGEFLVEIIPKYGIASSTVAPFLVGVLNANGILTDEEAEATNEQIKEILVGALMLKHKNQQKRK